MDSIPGTCDTSAQDSSSEQRKAQIRELLRRDEENLALTPGISEAHRAVVAASWRSILAEDSEPDVPIDDFYADTSGMQVK